MWLGWCWHFMAKYRGQQLIAYTQALQYGSSRCRYARQLIRRHDGYPRLVVPPWHQSLLATRACLALAHFMVHKVVEPWRVLKFMTMPL